MSTFTDEETSARRPQGPRAEARELAILEAALELLTEVGYDRLSMDALAERAHAGKATIYRHWSGKAQVVAAAVLHMKCERQPSLPATGSLRGDLLGALQAIGESLAETEAAIIAGVVSAMRTDPELAGLIRSQMFDTKKREFDEIVERAVRGGELPAGSTAAVIDEVVPAIVIFRLVLEGRPVDEDFATHVVDDVVLPLLHC